MYTLAVKDEFIARHFQSGGNWGSETEQHSHNYQIEVQLDGDTLDQNGFLVDPVFISATLNALLSRYRERLLNDLPEFDGINPSQEMIARVLCHSVATHIQTPHVKAIVVKVTEAPCLWASYRFELYPNEMLQG